MISPMALFSKEDLTGAKRYELCNEIVVVRPDEFEGAFGKTHGESLREMK